MSKKLIRSGLALAAGTAMLASTLVGAPAVAAGEVTLAPATGTGYTAFATDAFILTTTVQTAVVSSVTTAFRIDNPDQKQLNITVSGAGVNVPILQGISEAGALVVVDGGTAITGENFTADFATLGIVSLVIHTMTPSGNTLSIGVQLDELAAGSDFDGTITKDALEYGDLVTPTNIDVTSWVEVSATPNYLTVDAAYASPTRTISFVDPSSVSAVSKIERFVGATSSSVVPAYNATSVRVAAIANVADIIGDANDLNVGDSIDSVVLAAGDLVLLSAQTTPGQNGIYRVTAGAPTAVNINVKDLIYVSAGTVYADTVFSADGADGVHYVRAASVADVDADGTPTAVGGTFGGVTVATGNVLVLTAQTTPAENAIVLAGAAGTTTLGTIDAGVAHAVFVNEGTSAGLIFQGDAANAISSATGTATALNAGDGTFLGTSLKFSNSNINLAQVDIGKFDYQVDGADSNDTGYIGGSLLFAATPAGNTVKDGKGRLFFPLAFADAALDDGQSYVVKFRHSGDVVAPILEFSSPGYQVVVAPDPSTADGIKAAPTSSTDASVGTTYDNGYSVALRNGASAVTYKSQILDGANNKLQANVPVLAVVTAGANLPKGETLTVSGGSETISSALATTTVSGLTDSNGNWSVTVTSSDSSSAGAAYTIQFYALDQAAVDVWVTGDNVNSAIYKADYSSGSLATGGFTSDATVLSGAKPTVTFSVADQFGQALSATAASKAYFVELKAPSKTDLEQFVAVEGGKATFTFDNYLTSGESNILTARLFTGSSTSPSYVATATLFVSLYNANAVAAVNAPADRTGVIVTYDDFITGTASSTNVAPTDGTENGAGEDFVITGTAVDSNGAGVPGAPVTLAGTGFQFVKDGSTTYFVDSITLAANESGTYTVRGWTHVASTLGNVVTVTSGDKTASVKVKSKVEDGNAALSAANLTFGWDLPSALVMNTTYAVTATVTDKWGNPIKGATVAFSGLAAAQFNGSSVSIDRVTGTSGTAIAYLRSLKDVSGLSAVSATLTLVDQDGNTTADVSNLASVLTDVTTTKWDESKWSNLVETQMTFLVEAPAAASKVNAGSFKGYVALYAKGYEGQRMSAKVGNDWVIVPAIPAATNDLFRAVEFVGAGVDISVRIYIDRVLLATIPLLTK